MRNAKVWVVLHGEVVLTPDGATVDEAVTFVASSKRSAEALMRRSWVEPGTWWVLVNARLDDLGGGAGQETCYSRSVRRLRSRPIREGTRAAVARCRRAIERLGGMLAKARGEGDAPESIARLEEERRYQRRLLARHRKA